MAPYGLSDLLRIPAPLFFLSLNLNASTSGSARPVGHAACRVAQLMLRHTYAKQAIAQASQRVNFAPLCPDPRVIQQPVGGRGTR